MSPPQIRVLFSHAPAVIGLPLLGLGIVSSCASSTQPTPTPDYSSEQEAELVVPENREATQILAPTTESASPQPETAGESEPDSDEILTATQEDMELETLRSKVTALSDEVRALYRRLHIELPADRRSDLIVELLQDERLSHQILGFELADREISASAVLSDDVGQAGRALITSSSSEIRARSARLITRLAPPDAMLVLTEALKSEVHATAAEPMLLGIARWPNSDAAKSVLEWTQRHDGPLFASFSAALSLEREGIWDSERDHPALLSSLRLAQPRQLREDGMKLLALLGTADDQRRLVDFMLSEDPGVVRWAAAALVETPRAVEILEQAALQNEVFYQPAAESLIQHRATPDGLRRLSELPQSDPVVRRDMILRMGNQIDRDQLGEAVRLARLEPELTIEVLSTLIRNETPHTARTAKSVLTLADLQLRAGRPNRVIEALLSLENAPVDPADQSKLDLIRLQALLLLSRFDEAAALSLDVNQWLSAIELASDAQLRSRIASELLSRTGEQLDDEQRHALTAHVEPNSTTTDLDE